MARIALAYRANSQTSDEAANLACGMEWLDLGRYDYGPFHPPLARLAMSFGPYLYGARSQHLPERFQEQLAGPGQDAGEDVERGVEHRADQATQLLGVAQPAAMTGVPLLTPGG